MEKSFISRIILIFSCLLSMTLWSQEDSVKQISGIIKLNDTPISDVNVLVKGTEIGTKTDEKGYYLIQTKIGDIIQYTYVGLNTVEIIVEDVTEYLNIDMTEKNTQLEETIINARVKANSVSELEKKMNVNLNTPFGIINPARSGFSIDYIPGRNLNQASPTLADAIAGKSAGVVLDQGKLKIRGRDPIFIIDNNETLAIDQLVMSDIEDVYIVKNRALVVIRTIYSSQVEKEKKQDKLENLQNQNFYNADALNVEDQAQITKKNTSSADTESTLITVSGVITHQNIPIPQVDISLKGKNKSTKTDQEGNYSITAKAGEIIEFRHVEFKPVSILVEDITSVIDIDMVLRTNKLDEVVIKSISREGKESQRALQSDEIFTTSRGNFDPKRSGFTFSLVGGSEISTIYNSIGEALDGKMPGVKYDRVARKLIVVPISSMHTPQYPIWDVDGALFPEEPPLDMSMIKEVRVLKTAGATNKYGSQGAGGVVVVKTKMGDFSMAEANKNKLAEKFQNKTYYDNSASSSKDLLNFNSNYDELLKTFETKFAAYAYYIENILSNENLASQHIAIASLFNNHFEDAALTKEILLKTSDKFSNNPEIQKAIAYYFQANGFKKEAIETYQKVYYLRPNYAQSYRDVANAYIENEQFKRGWRLYMNYLLEGKEIMGEGIGPIVYNEMEYLYYNRGNQTDIKENFIPKNENKKKFENDVRMVFEWNTSEAEFELEFVNPELRSYVFDHSLNADADLIFDEKTKGYSSKEFMIDDIGTGQWLVNLTYKGNKKSDPTYFKVTTFYNWGKFNQTSEIAVYALNKQNTKVQLMNINEQNLMVSN